MPLVCSRATVDVFQHKAYINWWQNGRAMQSGAFSATLGGQIKTCNRRPVVRLTKQKYAADKGQERLRNCLAKQQPGIDAWTECFSWSECVLLLMFKRPWWVSTPRSACRSVVVAHVMHQHVFDVCVWFIVCMLPTAPGVIDPAEWTHNMGLFLFHARLFYIQHTICTSC